MTLRATLARIAAQEDLNFLLTNRIPRRLATRFIGWFSRIENPLVRDASIAIWRLFSDLDLSEARTTRFRSMHDCFIRELKEGARPIDPDPGLLTSPCDAIVGASGPIEGTRVFQVKGFPYGLADLVPDAATVAQVRDGTYVTLRLTSSMYHRFHAPHDCRVESVTHIAGDTWNVNPIALKRVEALFCRNERAVIRTRLAAGGHPLVLVPVAAILVASLRLRFLGTDLDLRAQGPRTLPCDARLAKGEEMGWFQHGSTIIVLAPPGFRLCEGVAEGTRIRMGEPLLRLPDTPA
ncbi:phosphatidylserine decarboxylase [Methylobacterium sp. 4-46]|uniref:archaetidylserine decarboxylase n=1 Tax=unclassified Methylobacterium TaxID=2615210 RepID=UPI000152D8AF|nr:MULTISPECIES: archaetidylserine decarboxylase [Methylobacterium]ACA18962.1 phosphatidylserine decarboxylase [Methylobacterium sp. 4-46]WFT78181.1 archaetidylserine decarboxylase [Methylobacterium nodulans]